MYVEPKIVREPAATAPESPAAKQERRVQEIMATEAALAKYGVPRRSESEVRAGLGGSRGPKLPGKPPAGRRPEVKTAPPRRLPTRPLRKL